MRVHRSFWAEISPNYSHRILNPSSINSNSQRVHQSNMAGSFRSQRLVMWGSVVLFLAWRNPFNLDGIFRVVAFHYAANLFFLAWIMATERPKMLGKQEDGSFQAWANAVWFPTIFQSWLLVTARLIFNRVNGIPRISTVKTGQLFYGAYPQEYDIEHRKIACVVDLTAELPKAVTNCAEYLCIPTLDGQGPNPDQVEQAVQWVCERIKQKKSVLIHCGYGIGRSSMVTSAVMVRLKLAPTWADAFLAIKKVRPTVVLNDTYINSLQLWASRSK